MKTVIRLTESDLHKVVKEAVENILLEINDAFPALNNYPVYDREKRKEVPQIQSATAAISNNNSQSQ